MGGHNQIVQKPYQVEWRVSIHFAKIDTIELSSDGLTLFIWTNDLKSYWNINTGMEQDARSLVNAIATLAVSNGSVLKSLPIGLDFPGAKEVKKLRKELGWKEPSNLIISEVAAQCPAETAGVHLKDIIIAVNGVPVKNYNEYFDVIKKILNEQAAAAEPLSIPITVVRSKNILELKWVAPNFNRGREAIVPFIPKNAASLPPRQPVSLGVNLRTLNENEQINAKVSGGLLIIAVNDGGLAARSGIRANDILVEVNGKPVKNIPQLTAILAGEEPNKFKVVREGVELALTTVFSM